MRLNVNHLWIFAVISYILAIFFAFNQEPLGVLGCSIIFIMLLVSTKWVNVEINR